MLRCVERVTLRCVERVTLRGESCLPAPTISSNVAISIYSTNGPGIGSSTSTLISEVSSELVAAGVVGPRMRGGMSLSPLLVPRLEPIITFIVGWLVVVVASR